IRENNIKIMLRSETKRREAAVNGSANSDVDGYASDIKSLSARLQQIRHYLRQAAQLRRSVGGRQGRNLDSLMQQLAAQERHCSAALEDRLRRHAGIDMAADQQSDGERDSEDVGDQDDADEDGDADEDVEVESKGRPTIESKLGRHPDTADTSQCGEDDSERGVDVDSGEELEALRNQRDLLRRMLQPAGSQQPQQHRQLPALPASNQQVASAGAPSEDALVKRLMDLESRRARLDQTLEELADLRADASTTSTEVQAAAGSFSARQTAGEAAQLLGAMETMQARLDRLRSVRDRLESVRQLADDYRRSGTSLSTNQSGGGGGQNGDDDGDGGNAEASAAERELRQLVLERQRLVDLQTQLELLHSAAGRDAAAAAAALAAAEQEDNDEEAAGQQEEEEEEQADADDDEDDEDGDDDAYNDGDSATFPAGLEARERQQQQQQQQQQQRQSQISAEQLGSAEFGAGAAQIAVCLQQCCALLSAQQQQLHRLTQQVNDLQQRQQQQQPAALYQSYPGYWWGFWGQHHPYQQQQQQQVPCCSCADTAAQRQAAMSTTRATIGSQTDLAQQSAFSAAESETDNSEAHSQQGFDRLRSSIYSEVAAVISQNESRPHYLIELFRELQLLSTDRLRQRALQQLQRLVNGYLASRPPWLRDSDDGDGEGDYDRGAVAVVVDVEQTPSESYATTTTSAAAEEATAEAPFARDSLGDTAINLDRAMRQVRQHQQQQRQHLLSSSSSGGRAAVAAGASASGRIDAEQLDRQVKSVVRHLIPALRARAQEVATPQLLKWVADLALQRVKLILDPSATGDEAGSSAASTASAASKDSEFDQFFARQLSSLLADSLARFRGHRLADCTEDMLVDLSELLFNELAFFRLVNNLDISNDDVPAAAGGDTDSVATEDVAANKAENEDAGQDEEEPDNGEETEGGDEEESEAETASAKAVEDYADDFEEAATSSDAEAAGAAVQNHEKEVRVEVLNYSGNVTSG
ncbi:hypothetical protein BOX15_Mlig001182g2, partial [Macrostomum lignano]